MNNIDIELLYSLGYIPNKFYYQLNGKTAQQNFMDIRQKKQLKEFENDNVLTDLISEKAVEALNKLIQKMKL